MEEVINTYHQKWKDNVFKFKLQEQTFELKQLLSLKQRKFLKLIPIYSVEYEARVDNPYIKIRNIRYKSLESMMHSHKCGAIVVELCPFSRIILREERLKPLMKTFGDKWGYKTLEIDY
jgi:predicted nucleotide-binding protein (sugar kinase/HSP70/actin superfamily)